MDPSFDFAVVGAGMAGASAAYELAPHGSVLLLEQEDAPGRHATGRSAALYSESYGNAVVRALTMASGAFLRGPPEGFAPHPVLTPRGWLYVGRENQRTALERAENDIRALGAEVRPLSAAEMRALVEVLRPEYAAVGLLEPGAQDIDVDALHQGYLKGARARGVRILTAAELTAVERTGEGWRLRTGQGAFGCAVLVNAAGAWADALAALAGVRPLGVEPLRRTAVLVDPPPGVDPRRWPAVVDVDEQFYFKPEAGRILVSPADETPCAAGDAAPDELDVAVAVERMQAAADIPVRRIARAWAGLRSFAPDRTPVVGFDPHHDGFFWLAGQGGYGIQTAPALARATAALAVGRALPSDLQDRGLAAAMLAPARFRSEAA